jgi:alkylhydroperoxidase family enzyme
LGSPVLGALLPGTDPVTTLLETLPLFGLYEATIVLLRLSERRRQPAAGALRIRGARRASPRAKIGTLTAWWGPEPHSEAEQAALRYTKALTRAAATDHDTAFQRFHDALAQRFTREEMLETSPLSST